MTHRYPLRPRLMQIGLALLILPILWLLGVYFMELAKVRECLAAGGHWDYLAEHCGDTPKPFVSWLERAPWLVNGGLALSIVGLCLTLAGLYFKRA